MSALKRHSTFSPANFRSLVAAATQVLLESNIDAEGLPPDFMHRSNGLLTKDLKRALDDTGLNVDETSLWDLLEDEGTATRLSSGVLDILSEYPIFERLVEQRYEERRQKMTGIEVTLLAGALAILAIRVKRLRVGNKQMSAEFEPAGQAVAALIKGLLGGGGGV